MQPLEVSVSWSQRMHETFRYLLLGMLLLLNADTSVTRAAGASVICVRSCASVLCAAAASVWSSVVLQIMLVAPPSNLPHGAIDWLLGCFRVLLGFNFRWLFCTGQLHVLKTFRACVAAAPTHLVQLKPATAAYHLPFAMNGSLVQTCCCYQYNVVRTTFTHILGRV